MNVNWMRWTMAMQVLFFVGWGGRGGIRPCRCR